MKFKKGLLILCLIICIFAIAGVSAADDASMPLEDNADSIRDANILSVSIEEDVIEDTIAEEDNDALDSSQEEILNDEEDDGTFTALQKKIENAESGSTISLDKDYSYDSGFSEKGILINKNITINGNGHTLNGLSKSRIFLITFGLKDNHKVVLNNIKFLNGNTDLYGGAIFNYANLTVNNCYFKNNTAKYCGGAINSVGHLYLKNSNFIKNTAGGDAGAVFTFSIDHAVDHFKNMYVDKTPDGDMEFIFNFTLSVKLSYGRDSIVNCTFNNNTAKGRCGGAVYGFTHLYINSCKFNYNKASANGGAVFANKNLTLKNSKFVGNKVSKNGGAVYFRCHEESGSYVNGEWVPKTKYYNATIYNSTFTKNTAAKGGAIYGFIKAASDKKRLKVNKCTFTANKASSSGRDVLGGTCTNCVFNYIKLTSKSVTVKKSAKKLTLSVKLTKGKTLLKNKKVTFRFRGKNYTAKTNSKGIAKVIIKRTIIKKLKAGSKYVVKISYLKTSIKRYVKVKK